MLKCEAAQQLIADRLYEALDAADESALAAHLEHCASCREVQQELHGALGMLRRAEMDSARAEFRTGAEPEMASLWSTLQPELDRIDAQRYQQLKKDHQRHRWITGMAIAASLALAVSLLTVFRPVTPMPVEQASIPQESATQDLTSAEYRDFLNRAQVALLSLANSEPGSNASLPFAREQAGFMAQEASLLNTGLNDSLSLSQLQLLNDIQYLLLQYANLEDGDLASGLQVLQLFLNNNTLLFKLNLAEMREANPVI